MIHVTKISFDFGQCNTFQDHTKNDVNVEISEKDFSQNVRLKNYEIQDVNLEHLNIRQRTSTISDDSLSFNIFGCFKPDHTACHDVIVGVALPIHIA